MKEDIARLCFHLVPYDGLGDASDKVLGKLFWSNGWLVLTPILRELNLFTLPGMAVMSRGRHPKFGAAHILLGLNCGLYPSKEKQSHPDDLAKLYLNPLKINLRKREYKLNIGLLSAF